ncbi:hypothetical protein [Anaerophilus nitritogenes]|uniref:hypothetical protein n=1 Tax=Anaerophilus nitritogenes TaxID=2498136 RepID=UPI00101B75D7|nr:hypothetical protein [Anaerophilus nitritogenes]
MKYKIWNKQDRLITPIGEVLSKEEIFARYPASAIQGINFIIADQPISMAVFMEFESTKESYKQMGVKITEKMTMQEVLNTITEWEENPPIQESTAEERIASALEFQMLMSLPNADTKEVK